MRRSLGVFTGAFALGACVIGAFVLAACSGSDVIGTEVEPTVPLVTTSGTSDTTTTPPPGADPSTSTATTSTTASAPTTTSPTTGDIDAVSVDIELVGVFNEPVDIGSRRGDDALWLGERAGVVRRVDPSSGETLEVVLDISDLTTASGERGLLGLALDDEWLYLIYTDFDGTTNVVAYALEPIGSQPPVDPDSRVTILTQPQPYRTHNGGGLAIGPDGYLYIGLGDGGGVGDPDKNAQNLSTWLGSILRIDPTPEGADPYAIPLDNPFVGREARPEIFIFGVRNPWRFSFDSATNNLWIADVGQNEYEEVNLLLEANNGGAGANLGWPIREGFHEFDGADSADFTDPVWEYDHDDGCSVTGGVVYRRNAIDNLSGVYLFADYCSGVLWGISTADNVVTFRSFDVDIPGGSPVGFATGPDQSVYTFSLNGELGRIVQS